MTSARVSLIDEQIFFLNSDGECGSSLIDHCLALRASVRGIDSMILCISRRNLLDAFIIVDQVLANFDADMRQTV